VAFRWFAYCMVMFFRVVGMLVGCLVYDTDWSDA